MSSLFNRQPIEPKSSIDLSSITDDPNYKRPERDTTPRPQRQSYNKDALREDSLSAIDALLADSRAQSSSKSTSPRPPSRFNTDFYSKGRTTTGTYSNRDPRSSSSLIADLVNSKARSAEASRGVFSVKSLTDDLERENFGLALRLKPSLGKTVKVNKINGDLVRALTALEVKINGRGNRVKRDVLRSEFHIRKGQLKKMMRRERWRKMFKEGYLAEAARVRKMIKQGW